MAQLGVPVKLLHEAEGHIITCETINGVVYRGKLLEAEDNMNCQMTNNMCTARDGKVTKLEQVYIRGSQIRFIILPDMLKNAPMFKRMQVKTGRSTKPTLAQASAREAERERFKQRSQGAIKFQKKK